MNYPMRELLPRALSTRTDRYWNDEGFWGNQGSAPKCVGYSLAHLIEDGPVTHTGIAPIVQPDLIYAQAQLIDEWPGTNYDGTSVRAGAEWLVKAGIFSSYHWAFTLQDIVQAVLELGPVEMGTNWYESMFYPNAAGVIRIGGDIAGGHAYVINGVNTKTRMFRIKNSWGRNWGVKGRAYMSFAEIERLLGEYGEACIPKENKNLFYAK
jgi:hypothetical protein